MPKVPQELQEAHVSWEVVLAETPKHSHVRLEPGEQTLRPLVHVTTRVFLLRMIDELVHIALPRPVATGRVGIEPTARLHRDVGCLLHRLDSEISGRLYDDGPLATDLGDDRGPVFVVTTPAGLALLAATPRSTSERFWPALLGLAFVPSDVVELIRFNRAFYLAIHLVGHRSIAQPPAPAITGPAMDAQLSGNTPRRTRETEQKRCQNPVRQ